MTNPRQLAGVLPIVHTPFTDDDTIDESSLRRQLDWAFDTGADGCGTGMVSEILRLTTAERTRLANLIPEIVNGRGPVFASVGAESTAQAVTWAKEAEAAGNDALMAIPPTLTRLLEQTLLGLLHRPRRDHRPAAHRPGRLGLRWSSYSAGRASEIARPVWPR